MKHLQWFPGHMTAAMRMMEDNLKAVENEDVSNYIRIGISIGKRF